MDDILILNKAIDYLRKNKMAKVEIPAPILYYLKQVEISKNKQERFEYLMKLEEIRDFISEALNKYQLEFLSKKDNK